jgi:hypothetical protein
MGADATVFQVETATDVVRNGLTNDPLVRQIGSFWISEVCRS